MKYFETEFLDQAKEFIKTLHPKTTRKVLYNIDLAEQTNDPKLFKKLQNDIWEFRTKYAGQQIRLLAFWDKTDKKVTLRSEERRVGKEGRARWGPGADRENRASSRGWR